MKTKEERCMTTCWRKDRKKKDILELKVKKDTWPHVKKKSKTTKNKDKNWRIVWKKMQDHGWKRR